MLTKEQKEEYQNEINVFASENEYDNCVICHEREVKSLIIVELPVSRTTLCKDCAKVFSEKILSNVLV